MKQRSVFIRIWSYLKHYKMGLFLAIFLKILAAVMNVLEPFVIGLAITEITQNVLDILRGVAGAHLNYQYVAWILVIYFFRGFFYEVGAYGSNYFMTNAVQATICDIRNAMSEKINRLPVAYFDQHQFGDMLGRFTADVESVSNALQQSLLQLVNAILTIILVLVMVFYLNIQLALVLVIMIPISYVVSQYILKKSQPYFKRQANILGELNGFVQENLTGFNVIKLYGREDHASDQFREITEDLRQTGFKAAFISALMMPVVGFVSHLAYLVIAFWGGLQVIAGKLSVGNLQAFVQYVWQVNQPIQIITQLAPVLQSAKAALERIFTVLDELEEQDTGQVALPDVVSGQVSFEAVDFEYVPGNPLIKQFNLKVQPGETVAIVGPTGAGKTTLINLLMRFYDVSSGAIKLDGVDIREIPRKAYREQFGMVLQDAWLFEGTIKENLRFGNLDASDEELIAAAKAANVDHFIRTLPGGYQMRINQESSNISLGQKQLLTIARALLSNPKILILDEATSSVDTRLELLIQKAMKRLMQGRTSFVIAHRLSTIQEADKILVLNEGQIVEQGNHESLLAQKGFYYNLYQSQFSK